MKPTIESCKYCNSLDIYEKRKGVHIGIYCRACGKWQTFIKQPIGNFIMPFGKYKGTKLINIAKEHFNYLEWLLEQDVNKNFKKRILEAIEFIQ